MKRELARLAEGVFDVAIVGGGIYGAAAAYEATRRGLSVALVERGDFGGATSSQSLKIVHGGLRYLQHLDLPRMRESIRERRLLMELAPHLVRPLPFVMPTYGHGLRGREAHALALRLSDLVGFDRSPPGAPEHAIPRGRMLSRAEVLGLCPGIESAGLTGGALWYDAQTWSTERLLLAFLESAARAGAVLANHCEATGLLREGARVAGLCLRDALGADDLELRARSVLSCAGPWVDAALARFGVRAAAPAFLPSKAMNLLTRRVLPGETAVGISWREDFRDRDAVLHRGRRLFFVVPWREHSLIGTRHLSWEGPPGEFRITEQDTQAFLDEVNRAYPPAALQPGDVAAVYGGMLPRSPGTPASGEVQLQKHAQLVDHGRRDGTPGLWSVVGVKWTTARGVAERAVAQVARSLGRGGAAAPAAHGPLAGADPGAAAELARRVRERRPAALSEASLEPLLRGYGAGAAAVLELAEKEPALAAALHPASPVIGAQLVYAAREEMALRLEDVVLRRTELWLARPADAALQAAADRMAAELGWDAARRAREIDATHAALRRLRPLG